MSLAQLPLPCSIGDLVDLSHGHADPRLVSEEAWASLRQIPDRLPAIAHEGALEIRMDQSDPRVDFSACLAGSRTTRARFAKSLSAVEFAALSQPWRRIGQFAQAWEESGSILEDDVDAAWIEFDALGEVEPQPFLIFSLAPDRVYREGAASSNRVRRPLRAGLVPLGLDPASATASALDVLVQRLERSAQVRHAAVRPMHGGDVVRLVIRLPRAELALRLSKLGWPGDVTALETLLDRLCSGQLVIAVNVDVGPTGIAPRIGLEFAHLGPSGASPRWNALFDALREMDAVSPSCCGPVASWSGVFGEGGTARARFCTRRDLLVKVVHESGVRLRAKAYLTFAPRLVVDAESQRVGGEARVA